MELKKLTLSGKGMYGIGASACDKNINYPTYLRITDISDDGSLIEESMKSINPEIYDNYNKYYLKANDIVFARTGNSTGRNYFNETNNKFVFAGFLIKFSLDDTKVVPKYVKYYCQTESYKKHINKISKGSTRKGLNEKDFGSIDIPLVSLSTQQHIVDII